VQQIREIKMKALKKMTTLAMGIAAIAVSAQTASAEKWDMPMAVCGNEFPFGNGGRFCR
jgi:Spy/CpxP family protein refolding chaperone